MTPELQIFKITFSQKLQMVGASGAFDLLVPVLAQTA